MRPQRVILENHADIALLRRQSPAGFCHQSIAKVNRALRRDAEPRQQAQQRAFAAAGWPQQCNNAARFDVQSDVIEYGGSAEGEGDAIEPNAGKRAHYRPPHGSGDKADTLTCDKYRGANIVLSSLGLSAGDYRQAI